MLRTGLTDDENELVIRIARIDEDPSNLFEAVHRIRVNRLDIIVLDFCVNVVRPLEAYADVFVAWHVPDSFDDSEAKQVLDKDDLARFGSRQPDDERELQASGRRYPRIAASTSTSNLVRGDARQASRQRGQEPVVPARALLEQNSQEISERLTCRA